MTNQELFTAINENFQNNTAKTKGGLSKIEALKKIFEMFAGKRVLISKEGEVSELDRQGFKDAKRAGNQDAPNAIIVDASDAKDWSDIFAQPV